MDMMDKSSFHSDLTTSPQGQTCGFAVPWIGLALLRPPHRPWTTLRVAHNSTLTRNKDFSEWV